MIQCVWKSQSDPYDVWCPAKIIKINDDNTYEVEFTGGRGKKRSNVPLKEITDKRATGFETSPSDDLPELESLKLFHSFPKTNAQLMFKYLLNYMWPEPDGEQNQFEREILDKFDRAIIVEGKHKGKNCTIREVL